MLLAEATDVAAVRPPDVLELGSGTGAHASAALAEAGFASIGIDSSGGALRGARERAEQIRGGVRPLYLAMDPQQLEFGDGAFDLVCGTDALHRLVPGPELGEIARVLRPGGSAVFVEPGGLGPHVLAGARRHFGRVEPRFFRRDLPTLLKRRPRPAVLRLSEPF